MVVIRLARGGAKKKPFYHVIATDKRNSRDGRFIERLGYYNPVARGKDVKLHLNRERVAYWQKVGAELSQRVQTLVNDFDGQASSAA